VLVRERLEEEVEEVDGRERDDVQEHALEHVVPHGGVTAQRGCAHARSALYVRGQASAHARRDQADDDVPPEGVEQPHTCCFQLQPCSLLWCEERRVRRACSVMRRKFVSVARRGIVVMAGHVQTGGE
jgi:hypothetical protein